MSKLEFSEFEFLMKDTNKDFIINDSDKNLRKTVAEKEEVIKECKRQLYDTTTHLRLSSEAADLEMLVAKIRMELLEVVINVH